MQESSGAYGIITQTLSVKPDEAAVAWVDRAYTRRFTLIRTFIVIACLISIVTSFLRIDTWVSFAFLSLGLIGLLVLQILRHTFARNIVEIRDKNCDPVLYCNRYLALLKQSKAAADPMGEIFGYALGLYWAGDWSNAERLMESMRDNLSKPKNRYLYHHLMARCAWAQGDSVALADHIRALEALSAQPIAKTQSSRLTELYAMAELLEREKNGEFEAAQETISAFLEQPFITNAHRAMLAFHKAYCSTERDEAITWLEYTVQNGGTTWYATEAKRLLAKTL